MKKFIFLILMLPTLCFADTTMSRDGDGTKISAPAFGSIRSVSVGTKGFKCWSTATMSSWELKVAATDSTDGAAIGFKYFINGSESVTYPVSDKFFQWQNSPATRVPTITKACLRVYSSATMKTAYGVFQ